MTSLVEVQLQQPQAAGDGHHTFPKGLAVAGIAMTAGFGRLERRLVPWTRD
jgi:hypothetical protein